MTAFDDFYFPSADQRLQLYARIYPGDGPPIVMMHGLTRNAVDFEGLAEHLAGSYQLIVPDQRGRGRSDYDPEPAHYVPMTYCLDMMGLVDRLALEQPLLIGTSMGGLMAMIMANMRPDAFRGIILNDIGPEVDQAGLDRIASYVGQTHAITNWSDAAHYCQQTNGYAFPNFTDSDWDAFAKRVFREGPEGTPQLAYDPAIAAGLDTSNPSAVPPDLWPMWQGLATAPTLAIRGEISDILTADTVQKMAGSHPNFQSVTVSGVGHAPLLDEPEALIAIQSFIAQHSKEAIH